MSRLGLILAVLTFLPNQAVDAQSTQSQARERSVGIGVGLGVASTVLPLVAAVALDNDGAAVALVTYSWIVGPLPGLAYAGNTKRGLVGAGIRTGTAVLGVLWALGHLPDSPDPPPDILAWIAVGGTLASWISDMSFIPKAVRQYNENIAVALSMTPACRPAVGFSVSARR